MTPTPLPGRMANHVRIDADGHWIWTGARGNKGYGQVGHGGQTKLAHRVAFEAIVGPIPEGMQLDHLCRVRACINPAHLEPVTPGENVRRGVLARLGNACPQGHEMTGANRYEHPRGQVICRACRAAYQRERRMAVAS